MTLSSMYCFPIRFRLFRINFLDVLLILALHHEYLRHSLWQTFNASMICFRIRQTMFSKSFFDSTNDIWCPIFLKSINFTNIEIQRFKYPHSFLDFSNKEFSIFRYLQKTLN